MKSCSKCKELKPLTEFSKDITKTSGYQSQCKVCVNEQRKEYYKANAEKAKEYKKANADKLKEYQKEYYKANADTIKERTKEYNKANADKNKEYHKEYYKANADKLKEKAKEYNKTNADTIKEYNKTNADKLKEQRKQYYKANADKLKEQRKQYYQANAVKIIEQRKQYISKRRKQDPLFKLTENTRNLIRISIKNNGYSKQSKTNQILGCSYEQFKLHIEQQFTIGMNWDNKHLWHLDHIIPVSLGLTEDEILALNHYTNFQPLWAEDNLAKGNNIHWQKCTQKYKQ